MCSRILQPWYRRNSMTAPVRNITCTSAILSYIASGICLRQHVAFLCSSYQAFSLGVLLVCRWCIHTLVLTQPKFGKKFSFILPEISDFHMIKKISTVVFAFARHILTSLSVEDTCPWGMCTCLLILKACHLSGDGSFLFKNTKCFICIHMATKASCCLP